ncbi:hypothetical protein EC988_009366, partial [Linderina pennispora]
SPLALEISVRETLDYDFQYRVGSQLDFSYKVTGEVVLQVHSSIPPLELAPVRLCVQRAENVRWVANPAVVTLDTSLTSSGGSGEWYRFVRPNLFAETTGSVTVFKYQETGSGVEHMRVMPAVFRKACTCTPTSCALMLFYEPQAAGPYAGDVLVEPALLVNFLGRVTSQASRPTGIWYTEKNSLLWKLDDIAVPVEPLSDDESMKNMQTLVIKAQGEGQVAPGPVAFRFAAMRSGVVDLGLSVRRGSAAVDVPVMRSVRSGKCTY